MNNNYFDDILKNSMETPRAIPFDESAWDRMEQHLSTTQPAWKSWLKFLPVAVGMLGLLTWNICLQKEINYMQKHPNVVQQEDAQPKIIHRVDTIYKIVERKITAKTIQKYVSSYIKNNGLSHTNNRFITPSNSFGVPNSFITSNSNNRFSGSYNPVSLKSNFITPNSNSDFFTSSLYNPYFSNLILSNDLNISNEDDVLDNSTDRIDTETDLSQGEFAQQSSNNNSFNEKDILNNENTTTDSELNNIHSNKDNQYVVLDEAINSKNILNELEKKPTKDIKYYQYLKPYEPLDIVSISRPNKLKPTFKSKLRFEEFSLGASNSAATNLVNGSTLLTYGVHAGAYILPNTSVELEFNYLNNNYSLYGNQLYPNNLPHPALQNIPADYNLSAIALNFNSVQMSLGLKRIVFKDEHIRPFGEIGWLPSKEINGSLYYSYSKREGGQTEFLSLGFIPLESEKYLNWDLSQMYVGGGLSFSLLNGRADLDLGIRYTQSLNSLFRNNIYSSSAGTTGIGSFASLTYNFNSLKHTKRNR